MKARPRTTAAIAAAACLQLGGCLDFVEPDIPHAGAPATLQITLVVAPDGTATTSGELTPGFDGVGLPRPVVDETLHVFGRALEPVEREEDGRRRYQGAWATAPADVLGPVRVEPPAVGGASPPAPLVWHGIRRVGPDTLSLRSGSDIVLEMEVEDGGTATVRQWFLDMAGSTGSVRLSADGVPPERLVIPAIWVPAPRADGSVVVTLNYVQSEARIGAQGSYVVSGSFHVRLRWTARIDTQENPNG